MTKAQREFLRKKRAPEIVEMVLYLLFGPSKRRSKEKGPAGVSRRGRKGPRR